MGGDSWYHGGSRELQDQFDTRPKADQLEERSRKVFLEKDLEFIAASPFFFLASASAEGAPDCSYKGGVPGFVHVIAPDTLAFPDYDGNGMFLSLGHMKMNPKVGLLFIDFEQPRRLRVNGIATVHSEHLLKETFPGAQLLVEVKAERIFGNCPRYIHRMKRLEISRHAPRAED